MASVAALRREWRYLSVAHSSSRRRRCGAADHMIPGPSLRSRLPLCIAAQISSPYGPRMKPGVCAPPAVAGQRSVKRIQVTQGAVMRRAFPACLGIFGPPPSIASLSGSLVSLTIHALIIRNVKKKRKKTTSRHISEESMIALLAQQVVIKKS